MKCLLCPREAAYRVRLICCGRDGGTEFFCSAEHAHKFRESYISGAAVTPHGYSDSEHASGHRRAGIIEMIESPR